MTACLAAVALALLTLAPPATFAHGGSARLVLEPDRVAPGGTLLARGDDFGADDEVRLDLVGASWRDEVAAVTSDGDGHFSQSVLIPVSTPAGSYRLDATSSSGVVLTAALSVEGMSGGVGPVRDPDDRLIVTPASPVRLSNPALPEPPPAPALDVSPRSPDLVPFLTVGIGAVVIAGLLALLVVDTARSRRRT
jgi:hypothetical protein